MTRRPRQTSPRRALSAVEIAARWWGGLPGVRVNSVGRARRPKKQDTTICPLVTVADKALASIWVRAALSTGQYRFLDADRDYPGRVWYRDSNGMVWAGYCINTIQGHYKGRPSSEEKRRAYFG